MNHKLKSYMPYLGLETTWGRLEKLLTFVGQEHVPFRFYKREKEKIGYKRAMFTRLGKYVETKA